MTGEVGGPALAGEGAVHPTAADGERNFVLQQGFDDPPPGACRPRYAALLFQPRAVAAVLLLGMLTQAPRVFAALGAVLWWSAALPRRSPFDAVYNRTLGRRAGAVRLTPAPPPRRFAQFLAGLFCCAIAALLRRSRRGAALVVEALFAAAVAALAFGRFCLGSFLFHLLRGRWRFALQTLPWAQGPGGGAASPGARLTTRRGTRGAGAVGPAAAPARPR